VHAPDGVAHHHRAHIARVAADLDDAPGDECAVIQKLGHIGAPLRLCHNQARQRPQGWPNRTHDDIRSAQDVLMRLWLERDSRPARSWQWMPLSVVAKLAEIGLRHHLAL